MSFISALGITAVYWVAIFVFFMACLLGARRVWRRGKRRISRYSAKLIWWLSILVLATIATSIHTENVAAFLACIFIFIPAVGLLFFQICFWSYNWLKHGDPFHENTRPFVKVIREERVVKQRKWCPICKKNSGCHVRKSPSGFMFHVFK